jgi:ribonuclease P protein component
MLPRKKRLSAKAFEEILEKGRTFHAPYISCRLYRLQDGEDNRFSFSVSKKIEKKATKRNLMRRRLAAIALRHKNLFPAGYAGIIFAKKGIYAISSSELDAEVKKLFDTIRKH